MRESLPLDMSPEAVYRRARAWRQDLEFQLAKAREEEERARVVLAVEEVTR